MLCDRRRTMNGKQWTGAQGCRNDFPTNPLSSTKGNRLALILLPVLGNKERPLEKVTVAMAYFLPSSSDHASVRSYLSTFSYIRFPSIRAKCRSIVVAFASMEFRDLCVHDLGWSFLSSRVHQLSYLGGQCHQQCTSLV